MKENADNSEKNTCSDASLPCNFYLNGTGRHASISLFPCLLPEMDIMTTIPPLSDIARPERMLLLTGAALVLTSIVYFFAWNWHAMPAEAKFVITGTGTALCMGLALAAERKHMAPASSLALFAAALFTGLFWIVFGQKFQSDATTRDFCLIWAASTIPLFLLRRTALLWNLLVMLLSVGICTDPLLDPWEGAWTSNLLDPLLVAAACCAIALLPPGFLRRSPGLNAWLTLPLTLLLAEATALCAMRILFERYQYHASLPEMLVGPLALIAVLVPAVRTRHAVALCETALCGVVLVNAVVFRLFDALPNTALAAVFTLVNLLCTVFLTAVLPRFLRWKEHPRLRTALSHAPSLLGGFFSALSFLALTAFVFSELDFSDTLLTAGLVYMSCGVLLWRLRGKNTFLTVFGSVLVTGGSLSFHIGLLEYSSGIILASVWGAAVLLYLLLNYPPLRFSAVFWALMSTLIFLPDLPVPKELLPLAAFFFCALPLFAAAAGLFPRGFLRPAAFACLCTLLLISPSFPPISDLRMEFGTAEEKITITLAALTLAALLWRNLPKRTVFSRPAPLEIIAAVIGMLVLWLLSPLENLIALNCLFAGLNASCRNGTAPEKNVSGSDRPLIFLGVLTLTASCLLFYYLPVFTFREKMMDMGIPGLCLLTAGLWMKYRLRTSNRAENTLPPAAPPLLRQALPFALCAAVLIALFCTAAADRKHLLQEGEEVLLPLAPKDPRAFLFGDYMALSYDLDLLLFHTAGGPGCLPLTVDEKRTAHASPDGILPGKDCKDVPVPALTVDRTASGDLRLRLPRRFYMEEGLGPLLENAAFAVLRFDSKNRLLLTGLADENGRLIRPRPEETAKNPASLPEAENKTMP